MTGRVCIFQTVFRIQAYLLVAVCLGWSVTASAEPPNWQCAGDPVVEHQNLIDLELTSESAAGATKTTSFDSGQAGVGRCNCPSIGKYYSYFTAMTELPVDQGWLKLNDYLEAQVYINIYGPGDLLVPFSKRRNAALSSCTSRYTTVSGVATGRKGKVIFRFIKGIVGEVTFTGRLATLYWQINDSSAAIDTAYPFAHINADIRIKALASCTFRAGDTLTVDLGDIEKPLLNPDGPPKDFTSKTVDLSLDCINTGAAGTVDYTFEGASGSEGNLLLTDLAGVGVGLRDGDDHPVGLGMDNAVEVPLVSGTSSFYVKPYPAKLLGQLVQSGSYTTKAVVTISLP